MGLSCSCDSWDGDGWYTYGPNDYTTAPVLGRRHRCCSCNEMIQVRATCLRFDREQHASWWQEIHLGIEEVELAPWWMCERCGDLYFSLTELGFCVLLGDDMRELVREYSEVYGSRTSGGEES